MKKINENKAQNTKEARPFFPGSAEALQPFGSDNLVAANGLCGIWGWPMVLIVRCTSAWEMHLRGQGWGGLQRLWPPAGDAVVLPEIGAVWSDLGGDTGSSGSGAKHPTPQSASPPQKSPKRISQNPAFTLPASEMLLVLFFYLRLLCPRL